MRVPDVEMAAQRTQQIVELPPGRSRSLRAAFDLAIAAAHGPMAPTFSINCSAGSFVLSGICTANTPPFGSAVSSRASTWG